MALEKYQHGDSDNNILRKILNNQEEIGAIDSSSDSITAVDEKSDSAAVTAVAGANADTQLVAANTSRKGLTVFNNTDKTLYLKLGTGASASSFTGKLLPQGVYEMPKPFYTGAVHAFWDAGVAGNALVTQLT